MKDFKTLWIEFIATHTEQLNAPYRKGLSTSVTVQGVIWHEVVDLADARLTKASLTPFPAPTLSI